MKKNLLLLFVLMLLPVMASAFEGNVVIKGICYHILTIDTVTILTTC